MKKHYAIETCSDIGFKIITPRHCFTQFCQTFYSVCNVDENECLTKYVFLLLTSIYLAAFGFPIEKCSLRFENKKVIGF